jgi:hypothetical protein
MPETPANSQQQQQYQVLMELIEERSKGEKGLMLYNIQEKGEKKSGRRPFG